MSTSLDKHSLNVETKDMYIGEFQFYFLWRTVGSDSVKLKMIHVLLSLRTSDSFRQLVTNTENFSPHRREI